MRIILQAGVQCTDNERLIKTLLRNKETFAKAGVAVLPFKLYRNLLLKTLIKGINNNVDIGAREHLLETILDGTSMQINTVNVSNPMFFEIPRELLRSGQLYPNAVKILEQFLLLFSQDDVELYFSTRNPTSFLPTLFETSELAEFSALVKASNPFEIQWSEPALRLHQAFPNLLIRMW